MRTAFIFLGFLSLMGLEAFCAGKAQIQVQQKPAPGPAPVLAENLKDLDQTIALLHLDRTYLSNELNLNTLGNMIHVAPAAVKATWQHESESIYGRVKLASDKIQFISAQYKILQQAQTSHKIRGSRPGTDLVSRALESIVAGDLQRIKSLHVSLQKLFYSVVSDLLKIEESLIPLAFLESPANLESIAAEYTKRGPPPTVDTDTHALAMALLFQNIQRLKKSESILAEKEAFRSYFNSQQRAIWRSNLKTWMASLPKY